MKIDLGPMVSMLENFAFEVRKLSMKQGNCCELDVVELIAGGQYLVGVPLPLEGFLAHVKVQKARVERHPKLEAKDFPKLNELGIVDPTIVELLVGSKVVEVWLIPHATFECYKNRQCRDGHQRLGRHGLVPG